MYAGREYDASWRDAEFERVFAELGGDKTAGDIVDALKKMYTMYTDDLVEWYANLYDPYLGAYYCTTSGKENEGFLPDIESTVQALRFLENSGMLCELGGDWREAMSDEFKAKLIKFVKRMQLPNGYFYNFLKTQEQIDSSGSIAKRGRDLGWCTSTLAELGAKPTYDTPNGVKGDGLDAEGNPVADFKPYVAEKGCEEPKAAAVNYPEYLENKDTLIKYLNENVDIVNKSYWSGNLLNATYPQYKARDRALGLEGKPDSLCETLINWLNERINPETGYWSPLPTFAGTNGYFKTVIIYNAWGYAYPCPERAAQSVLAGILGDEPSTGNICEVYNLWSALISTKENVKRCHPAETRDAVLKIINDAMKEQGAAAILNTYKKQSAYQMPDGAYAHNVHRCITSHQGGIPVGLGLEEGDVDAIGKATNGIVDNVFAAYEIKKVPIYHDREWQIYKKIIDNAKPVIKKETHTYR